MGWKCLSASALVIALLGATPLGGAARSVIPLFPSRASAGVSGAASASGISGYQIVSASGYFGSATLQRVTTAVCPSGKRALGGGMTVNPRFADVGIVASRPTRGGSGWYVEAHVPPPSPWSVDAWAVCANVP